MAAFTTTNGYRVREARGIMGYEWIATRGEDTCHLVWFPGVSTLSLAFRGSLTRIDEPSRFGGPLALDATVKDARKFVRAFLEAAS